MFAVYEVANTLVEQGVLYFVKSNALAVQVRSSQSLLNCKVLETSFALAIGIVLQHQTVTPDRGQIESHSSHAVQEFGAEGCGFPD